MNRLKSFVNKFENIETPFYFYDTELLKQTLQTIQSETRNDQAFHVHYAIKANANERILRQIAEAGLGADCVSGGEVEAALAAGFPASAIVFAGVGKNDREIRLGIAKNINCFNVESIPELETINALAAESDAVARVAFRINPNVDAHTHAKITTGLNENKFGLAMEDMLPAIRLAEKLPHVKYVGLHFHIGSQILDFSVFKDLCLRINELQETLERENIITESINVGGGLGIDYEYPVRTPIPDFKNYFDVFRTHLRLRPGQQLHFELGRSVVAQCGHLISRILYVKKGHTRQFLIVDAGFTELIRPAMYGAVHSVENLSSDSCKTEAYDVVGPICESSDVFGKDMQLPSGKRGDLVAFMSAGAYGEVMASCYNCRHLPFAYFSE